MSGDCRIKTMAAIHDGVVKYTNEDSGFVLRAAVSQSNDSKEPVMRFVNN
jgi:hypothetical protein